MKPSYGTTEHFESYVTRGYTWSHATALWFLYVFLYSKLCPESAIHFKREPEFLKSGIQIHGTLTLVSLRLARVFRLRYLVPGFIIPHTAQNDVERLNMRLSSPCSALEYHNFSYLASALWSNVRAEQFQEKTALTVVAPIFEITLQEAREA